MGERRREEKEVRGGIEEREKKGERRRGEGREKERGGEREGEGKGEERRMYTTKCAAPETSNSSPDIIISSIFRGNTPCTFGAS